jgi:type IV secretion system protein VirB6
MDPRDGLTNFYGVALAYFDTINEGTIRRAWGLFSEHQGLVTSLLALFLILYFMWGALGRSHISVQDMAVTGFKVALAYAFVISWATFHENIGELILETPEQLGAALSSRMAGIEGGKNMAEQVRQVAEKVYDFGTALGRAQGGAWVGAITGTILVLFIVGFGLIPMLLILTGVTLFAKMIVALMLAVGPVAILCYFFGIVRFVFGAWVKGIAYGIFALLFTYVIAGFCFGFVRSYLDSIDLAVATQEDSFAVAAGLVAYMLVVALFVGKVPGLAQTFAYGVAFDGIPGGGGVGEVLQKAARSGSKAAALAASMTPGGLVAGAARGAVALGGDGARGTRAMGRMLADRMRGRSG